MQTKMKVRNAPNRCNNIILSLVLAPIEMGAYYVFAYTYTKSIIANDMIAWCYYEAVYVKLDWST